MQHEDVLAVLGDPIAQELMHSPVLARMAYVGIDGGPRAIPVGYLWNGAEMIVCTATNAPKVRALQANPKVALTIDTDATPPHILLVRGRAEVQVVDGIPSEYLEASQRYIPADQWDDFTVQVRALYPQMARIAITPEWAKIIDFETRLPQAVQHLVSDGGA